MNDFKLIVFDTAERYLCLYCVPRLFTSLDLLTYMWEKISSKIQNSKLHYQPFSDSAMKSVPLPGGRGASARWTAEQKKSRLTLNKYKEINYIKGTLLSFLKVCLYSCYTNSPFHQTSLFHQLDIVSCKISKNHFHAKLKDCMWATLSLSEIQKSIYLIWISFHSICLYCI